MKLLIDLDINAERPLIIRELQNIEDISLLEALKHMIYYALKNEGRISIEQYNKEIEEAEEKVDQGEFFTQDEVEKMAEEW
ncbi:hypothetical protein [Membranihabitans maritimus]|uniref:hypothetical protein n=1 Tax=Membranihabitans maritimus TaxID=2904244 RepID=UPI001F17ABCE|nr:hypothetical protein [Membranihabitans maritimus]